MVDRSNLSNSVAEDIVFSNLGLSREDLGLDPGDQGSGNEGFEQGGGGSGNEGLDDQGGSGNEDQFNFLDDVTGDDQFQQQQRQPQNRGQQQNQDDQSRVIHTQAEVKADSKGNLVNAQGQIVARAGKEARLYQDLHKSRAQLAPLRVQTQDLGTRLNKAVEIGRNLHSQLVQAQAHQNAVRQFGLDQGEHLTAMRLFKELRDNPKEAIKNILTRAATNGINVAELGLAPGGIDSKSLMDVVRQTIDQAVNPLRESTEAAKKAKEAETARTQHLSEIQTEVSGFFDSNPDAKRFLPVFTKTAQQFPGMSLGEIWARIQLQLATNPPQRRTNSRGQNDRSRSLPNGRHSPGAGANAGDDGDIAPVTESYDEIIRKAMRAGGLMN